MQLTNVSVKLRWREASSHQIVTTHLLPPPVLPSPAFCDVVAAKGQSRGAERRILIKAVRITINNSKYERCSKI